MEKILVTGAAGQIGSDLVPELRRLYGNDNVIAAGHVTPLPDDIRASGPCITLDVRSYEDVERVIKEYGITVIYHLSSLLSVLAEANRPLAYAVNFTGNFNILEASLSNGVKRVNLPSSIAVFGADAPSLGTPNDVSLNPTSLYGVSKVYGENMGTYYRHLGLDVRGTRLPGIISWKTEPTAGTTDYAVAIFYGAISEGRYTCYLRPDTALPMMYMPDAIRSLILLDQADPSRLIHSANFNLTAMSFTPARDRPRDRGAHPRLPDRLRNRPLTPGHRRLLARLHRRLPRTQRMGLETRIRPTHHGRRYANQPPPQTLLPLPVGATGRSPSLPSAPYPPTPIPPPHQTRQATPPAPQP